MFERPDSSASIIIHCALRAVIIVAATMVFATSAFSAEVIDLKQGARTTFYGGILFDGRNGDVYGWAIAFGDIDGDGRTDFLGSSANAEGPSDEHNRREYDVYLFFGRERSEIDSLYDVDAPGVADIVFYRGGYAMACADLDNDGYDDVILTDGYTNEENEGVFVVFGAPREQLRPVYDFDTRHYDFTPPDVTIVGNNWLGGHPNIGFSTRDYGVSLALISGDVNGDGYADIIVGDNWSRGPLGDRVGGGATHIVFGRPRGDFPPLIDVNYDTELPHPDVAIYAAANDRFPISVALGDLDGDGVDDLLATTTRGDGEDDVLRGTGEIYGYWGKRAWESVYDLENEAFDFALSGQQFYNFGYRLVTGDLDGDGRDDLIVGSPKGFMLDLLDDRGGMGEYRVYFGRPRGMWPRWGSAIEMTVVFLLGASTGDAWNLNGPGQWTIAFSLATGNRDGDGYDDLLIGAGHADGPDGEAPRNDAGEAYLVRGRPRGEWPPFIDLRDGYDIIVYGAKEGTGGFPDFLGATVGMADFDGNGYDELFLAAPFADGPDNFRHDAGEIYVIYDPDTASIATPTPFQPQPARATLFPNYPNPFTPATTFRFRAPPGEPVSLTVYDALGREVAHPLRPQQMTGEEREIVWEATDARGRSLPSGVYFVKLRAGREAHSRKVLLVR